MACYEQAHNFLRTHTRQRIDFLMNFDLVFLTVVSCQDFFPMSGPQWFGLSWKEDDNGPTQLLNCQWIPVTLTRVKC